VGQIVNLRRIVQSASNPQRSSAAERPRHPSPLRYPQYVPMIHDIGIANQIGNYSDAIEAQPGRMLFISGTPGLTKDGHLPETFEGQAEQAWINILEMLTRARMGPEHLVKVSQYLIRAEDIPKYKPIRAHHLGNHRPAFLLAVIPGLVRPDFLIEIEAYAVVPFLT
jgi:2-iminobutanoate/2-iminopropanoate deaminase